MMNSNILRWVTVLVAMCVVLGTAGFVRGHMAEDTDQPLERLASMIIGPMVKLQLEITGMDQSLEPALLSSRKAADAAPSMDEPSEPADDASVGLPPETAANPEMAEPTAAEPQQEQEQPQQETPPASEPDPEAVSEQASEPEGSAPTDPIPSSPDTSRKIALIYHSHNRESWLPELEGKDQPNEAFDGTVNVSLLGARLQEKLEESGVGAVHSDTDYNTAIPSFNYNFSYKYSSKTVKEAMAVHRELTYLFDIHRDSQRRDNTTITIDGKDYAKLYFIIGQANPHWEQNEAFAQKIHEAMEAKLPGVSKGILTKGQKHGNGEYNQSLSPASVLIELGGVDNTLEENYRTIDALASVIAELVKEAEKVDGPAPAAANEAGAS